MNKKAKALFFFKTNPSETECFVTEDGLVYGSKNQNAASFHAKMARCSYDKFLREEIVPVVIESEFINLPVKFKGSKKLKNK